MTPDHHQPNRREALLNPSPELIALAFEHLPSPYEQDIGDAEAMAKFIRAIAPVIIALEATPDPASSVAMREAAHEGEGVCALCGTHGCCDCVTEPKCAVCATLPVQPEPVEDEVERVAVGLSDKIILRLDVDEDDPRLSAIIDELRVELAALSRATPSVAGMGDAERWPDIGSVHPLQMAPEERARRDDRLFAAFSVQQKGVPDQTALVWRTDLIDQRHELIRLRARLENRSTPSAQHPVKHEGVEERFWLVLQEPGCVPERKGSWPISMQANILREFIAARPTAYIHVLTIDYDGSPWVDHGPEVLQMIDGRSMSTGRKHNRRVREAHAAQLATLSGADDEGVER